MLVREMHIGIDIGVQKMNSEKLEDLRAEEKDWVLNEAQLRFIKNRTNRKSNQKKDGFEDTIKRYEDIEELIESVSLPVYIKDSETMFSILPYNHFLLVDSFSDIIYNCNDVIKTEIDIIKKISIVKFKEDTVKKFKEYKLSYNDGTNLTDIFNMQDYSFTENSPTGNGLIDNEERFYIVAHILEVVNRLNDLEVYWENYNGKYYPNSFIFTTNNQNASSIDVNIDLTTIETYNFTDLIFKSYTTDETIKGKYPHRLVKTDDIRHLMQHSFGKTIYSSPLSTMSKNFLNCYHDKRFIFSKLYVEYIRKPRLISLSLNQSCSLNDKFHEEIVDEAVQLIKARINANDYRNIINENLLKE